MSSEMITKSTTEVTKSSDRNTGDPCPDADQIVGYLLGTSDTGTEVEQHLRECADCRLEFEAMREAIRRTCGSRRNRR
jgi:hypothetical protein